MARAARIPVEVFEEGRAPALCWLSGQPTEDRVHVTASTPERFGWLIVLGVVPWLLLRSATRRSVRGTLPLTEDVHRRIVAGRRATRPLAAVAVGLVVLGVVAIWWQPLLGLALVVLGGLVALGADLARQRRDPLASVRLDPDGRWVELPQAADAFADAVAAAARTGTR